MTDNRISENSLHDNLKAQGNLDSLDDFLVQSFFSNMQMEEIPDDGFSDRVMAALPSGAETSLVSKRRRLERVWTAVCVGLGVLVAVLCQGWEQVQSFFFSLKIDCLLTGSRLLVGVVDSMGSIVHNLWMMLAGMVVLFIVWAYNALVDAE